MPATAYMLAGFGGTRIEWTYDVEPDEIRFTVDANGALNRLRCHPSFGDAVLAAKPAILKAMADAQE